VTDLLFPCPTPGGIDALLADDTLAAVPGE